MAKTRKPGQNVEVEIWNNEKGVSEWHPAIITQKVAADDRPFRYHVKLNNGNEIGYCAPECIRKPQINGDAEDSEADQMLDRWHNQW